MDGWRRLCDNLGTSKSGGADDRRPDTSLVEAGVVRRRPQALDGNGEAQSRHPGFISRVTLVSREDPTKITSLVMWESNDIYDSWRASPVRVRTMAGADELWSRPAESERFDVVS